ncbi:MAG TPA: hypothetical protein VGP26_31390 [Actinophytocola sp.]|jgi:hypothetical protein|nr:hypothetical protein [Actinophytocola sp.]
MVATFVGAAAGSMVTTAVYAHSGWTATMFTMAGFVAAAAGALPAARRSKNVPRFADS